MNLNDKSGPDEFEPDEVDSLLEAAYQRMLDHVRATVDPARRLAEIMKTTSEAPRDRPDGLADSAETEPGQQALRRTDEPIDLDLGFVLCLGDALGRAIDTVLDLVTALDGHPAEHALALTRTLFCNVKLARDFEPTRASAELIDFALDLGTPAALGLGGDLDRNSELDWARIAAQARFLDFARVFAQRLIRILESDPGPALDLARNVNELLATASDVALRRAAARNLKEIYINAAGRDLSWLDSLDTPLPVPAGTVWDEQTILPPSQATTVDNHSIKIGWGRRQFQAV